MKTISELGVKMRRLAALSLLLSLFFLPGRLSAVDVIEEWVARYDGPGNSDDYAKAMAVDASGNVYVTGHSRSDSSHYDYATAKYDSAGNQLWVARYNGPGNYNDNPKAIALDNHGNVYVTGHSYGDGTSSDYATIKYNSNGIEQWVARYNGSGNGNDIISAMALDADGNVYITGNSYDIETFLDYTTIKYDGNGNQLWVVKYNGPGNYNDKARAIDLDTSGNVYVTGYSYGGSITREDYTTVKYDSSGNQLWVARYCGPTGSPYSAYDVACAIIVDISGNAYVTGYSDGGETSYDYTTIMYDSEGVERWVARYNGSGNTYDYAQAIALDSLGGVYITGYSDNNRTRQDYATLKYDSSGKQLWVATYSGPTYHNDRAGGIEVDPSGNVYVTGYSYDSSTSLDYATVKYDSSGNELWVATYDGPVNLNEPADDIPPDKSDDELFVPTENGLETDCDYAYAIALDQKGNVYVTGGSYGNGTRYDYATIKYSQEDTPRGYGVEVSDFITGVTCIFDAVVGGGKTTVMMTEDGPVPPAGTQLVPSGFIYDMDTTAVFNGTIQIAINYDDTGLTKSQESALRLRRYEILTNRWVDITTGNDIDNNIIYGETRHLSYFAVTTSP
jgi:uncharacterized delta-60 repeat protein